MKRAWFLAGLVCAAAALWASAPASAIVVGDEPNNHVVTAPSIYDGVGYTTLAGGATAVMANSWYIMTAWHVAGNSLPGQTFRLDLADGPHYYSMAQAWKASGADLGIIRLTTSPTTTNPSLTGYGLYTASDETSYSEVQFVGYGMSGTPATVEIGGDPNYPKGTKRLGYNKVYTTGTDPNLGSYLASVFDKVGLGKDKEAMIADGDSGSPMFIQTGGSLKIAGIGAAVGRSDPNHWPKYNDWGYHVRVSTYASWINGFLTEPTGDFTHNHIIDAVDIDTLVGQYTKSDMWYDLTGNGLVDKSDTDKLVHEILATEYGDVGLDHMVDYSDYQVLANHFGLTGTFGWADGDFNGDKTVNFADYQILEAAYGFGVSGAPLPPLEFIPEPASMAMLLGGGLMLAVRRWRQFL